MATFYSRLEDYSLLRINSDFIVAYLEKRNKNRGYSILNNLYKYLYFYTELEHNTSSNK